MVRATALTPEPIAPSSWYPGVRPARDAAVPTANDPEVVRNRVGAPHQTRSTYLNAFTHTVFVIERVVEPAVPVPPRPPRASITHPESRTGVSRIACVLN
jgi:uncharacterized protein (DUF2461 family)